MYIIVRVSVDDRYRATTLMHICSLNVEFIEDLSECEINFEKIRTVTTLFFAEHVKHKDSQYSVNNE